MSNEIKIGDRVKTPDLRNNTGQVTKFIGDNAVVTRFGTQKVYKLSSLILIEKIEPGPAEIKVEPLLTNKDKRVEELREKGSTTNISDAKFNLDEINKILGNG